VALVVVKVDVSSFTVIMESGIAMQPVAHPRQRDPDRKNPIALSF